MVRSVRVCDILEQNLVPTISMQSSNHDFFCVGVMYSNPTMVGHIFQAFWVRIYTQSNIILLDYIDIEGARFCSEISYTRTDLTSSSVGRALG